MLEIKASDFVDTMAILQQTIHMGNDPRFPVNTDMSSGNRASSREPVARLREHVRSLDAIVSGIALDELLASLDGREELTYRQFGDAIFNIHQTIRRELLTKKLFALVPGQDRYFAPAEPLFGAQVAANFPSLIYEIDQAGKCYACDLTTASAFHSIRCLEAGVRAISRCLGIPDPTKGRDRNWGNISRSIHTELERRWPASSGRMTGDAQLFDEIYGAFSGMQNPYRNATMHLEANYTAPEALHIFEIVKGLMQKLASRMDEQGLPLA